MTELKYLAHYPETLQQQVAAALEAGRLGPALLKRYPHTHAVRTDAALYDYVTGFKAQHMRSAPPLSKAVFDAKLHIVRQALGTHTRISRVQGGKLKAKREIRVASLFRDAPEEFLRMIVAHELAHLKQPEHDKAFYALCQHIEPAYHQFEFDLRAYLCWLESGQTPLWGPARNP